MRKLAEIPQFQDRQNIILQGFDPISAGGFTQVPNFLLKDPKMSANAKVVYSCSLMRGTMTKCFPGRNGWPKKSVRPGQRGQSGHRRPQGRPWYRPAYAAWLVSSGSLQVVAGPGGAGAADNA